MQFKQTTVSIWTHLKPKLLSYCELLNTTTSAYVNDLLSETFARVEDDQPGVPSFFVDKMRRKLGKDTEILMSEALHRQLAGIDPVAEDAKESAGRNTSRIVPIFLRGRRRGWTSDRVCQSVCGRVETELAQQLRNLYDDPVTLVAANEKIGGAPSPALSRIYHETYIIMLRHILALAIGHEIPHRFKPLFENER